MAWSEKGKEIREKGRAETLTGDHVVPLLQPKLPLARWLSWLIPHSHGLSQRLGAALLVAQLLPGCATYSDTIHDIEQAVILDNPEPAIHQLEEKPGSLRDEVLRQLNLAILLRMRAEYQRSNAALEAAKALIAQREAVSVTEQASSLVINEAMTSYLGADFEQAMIHFYAALNYLQLNQPYEARVEALQADLLLQRLAEANPDDGNIYSEDALCRYLAGMIFENLGQWSDALIEYRKAFGAYERYRSTFGVQIPTFLKEDLLRLSEQQGLQDEFRNYETQFELKEWMRFDAWQHQGEIVFLLHAGLSPLKQSRALRVIEPKHGQLVSIALPGYVSQPDPVRAVEVSADAFTVRAERVQDIGAIAERTLEARIPLLTAKALGRASLKYNITRQAEAKEGGIAGLLVNLIGAFTEVADTRSWVTLPDNIYLARLRLAPGVYTVRVHVSGLGGNASQYFTFENVTVRAARKTFLEKHWAGRARGASL